MNKNKLKRLDAARLNFVVYLHEWLPPFGWRYVVVPIAIMFFMWFAIWPPFWGHNIPYRSTRTAITIIERIDHLRPKPKQGFALRPAMAFRVENQELVYPTDLAAAPGEYVAVQYTLDFKGHVMISSVSLTKNPR